MQHAPTTIEGAACWQAAMLCLVPGLAGPQLDFASAVRIAEGLGADLRISVTLLGMIREGMDEGFAKTRTERHHG